MFNKRKCSFFLGFIFLWSHVIFAETDPCSSRHCAALVDAGSSGSRLFVYAYDLDSNKKIVNIKTVYSNKLLPGIHSLNDKAHVNDYLTALFNKKYQRVIPTYIFATAGMRSIPEEKQRHIYDMINAWFVDKPQWKLKSAETIDGQQEGKFGWLTINYTSKEQSASNSVLDIGGISIQVVFPLTSKNESHDDAIIPVSILDKSRWIYSKSFFNFGVSEIYEQLKNTESCFPVGYPLPNGKTGQGDAEQCELNINQRFDLEHSIGSVIHDSYKNIDSDAWYTLGAAAEIAKNKPFNFTNDQFSLQEFLSQVDSLVCKQDWSTLSKDYEDNPFISRACLNASYFYSLVTHALKFQPEQHVNYLPDNTSWTLGALYSIVTTN